MANDSTLPPQDPNKPEHPLRPADEWQLNDENVFDENVFDVPKTEPLDDDDALGLDDIALSSGPSTSFVGKIQFPPAEPDDALADLPPVAAPASGSGWLDVPLPRATPAPKSKVEESSDIFGASVQDKAIQGESDVIRNLSGPKSNSSNIYDSPLAGSSRFESSDDGTEDVTDDLFARSAALEPSSNFFTDDPDLAPMSGADATDMIESLPLPMPISGDSGPDFNRTNQGDSGSNLFADSSFKDEFSFGESGVNLTNPDRGPDSDKYLGAGSSIFGADLKDLDEASRVDVGAIPLMGSSDDRTEAMLFDPEPTTEGSSNIFERGKRLPGGMKATTPSDIDLQDPLGTEDLNRDPDGGRIDWSLPASGSEEDQLSAQMSVMPSELTADMDVSDLFEEEDQSELPITATASRKRASFPVPTKVDQPPRSSRTLPFESAPEPGRRRGGMGGVIAGGITGLVLGVGGFAGAYFGGVLPDGGEKQSIKELTGKLTYAESNANAAKREVEKAEGERTSLADKLAAGKKDLTEARTTASSAERARQQADAARQQADRDKQQLAKDKQAAIKDLDAAKATLAEQSKQLTDATTKANVLAKDVTDAKKLADEQTTLAKAADEKAIAAAKKALAADAAVVDVIKELKANKLVDDKDDTAAVIAKLPDILKKVTSAATSADAQKAAIAVKDALKKVDDARAEATKAKGEATLAQANADKATLDAKTATAALTVAKDDAQKKFDELRTNALLAEARAKIARDDSAMKLASADRNAASQSQLIEQLRKQVVEARSGAIIPLSAPEIVARDQAESTLGSGIELYFAGRYTEAEKVFRSANATNPNDARIWYFLGLSQWMQGNRDAAEPAFKKGAELENRGQPGVRAINAALERVQGPARQALAKYRP